jgi:hypothetical protein
MMIKGTRNTRKVKVMCLRVTEVLSISRVLWEFRSWFGFLFSDSCLGPTRVLPSRRAPSTCLLTGYGSAGQSRIIFHDTKERFFKKKSYSVRYAFYKLKSCSTHPLLHSLGKRLNSKGKDERNLSKSVQISRLNSTNLLRRTNQSK